MRLQGKLWHHRDFLKFWTGDTLSQFLTQVSGIAIPTIATKLFAADSFQIGVLIGLTFLPFPTLGLVRRGHPEGVHKASEHRPLGGRLVRSRHRLRGRGAGRQAEEDTRAGILLLGGGSLLVPFHHYSRVAVHRSGRQEDVSAPLCPRLNVRYGRRVRSEDFRRLPHADLADVLVHFEDRNGAGKAPYVGGPRRFSRQVG